MATRRRKPPLQDAIEYAARGVDKMAKLEVEYINSFKGTVFVYIIHWHIDVGNKLISKTHLIAFLHILTQIRAP